MKEIDEILKTASEENIPILPAHLWSRVENKLISEKHNKKIRLYRLMAIASSIIALVAIISLMCIDSFSWNPKVMAYSGDANLHLEDLHVETDVFYNVENVHLLCSNYGIIK